MHLLMTLLIGDVAKWIIFSGDYATNGRSTGAEKPRRSEPANLELLLER